MTKVSIILPTYNWNKSWIWQSIDSVLNQTFTDFELIIINDASTNNIEKTILEYVKKDNRIRYFKNEKNLKLTNTLNKWLELAIWQYIARIDDDDIWIDIDKLKKQVEFLDNNSDYWLCWTNAIAIDNLWNKLFSTIYKQDDLDIRKKILFWTHFLHVSILFRKECINSIGYYNPSWNLIEDHELWLRIWIKYKLYNIQDFCVKYRINPNWTSVSNRKKQRYMCLKLTWIFKNYYENFIIAFIFNILNMVIIYLPMNIVLFLMKTKNNLISWKK